MPCKRATSAPPYAVSRAYATAPDLWHYRDHGPGTHAALASIGASLDIDALYASPLGSV